MPTGYSKITGENPFKGKKRGKFSKEHREKLKLAKKKNPVWCKGTKGIVKPNKGSFVNGHRAIGSVDAMVAHNKKLGVWNRGTKGIMKPNSTSFQKGDVRISGKNSNSWKGGITPINEKIRKSPEYIKWREAVFKRDNWTCTNKKCKKRGGVIHADHIKRFSDHPELRLELSNGRTLCVDCHKKTKTYGRKKT